MKIMSRSSRSLRGIFAAALLAACHALFAADTTITGNLSVTGTTDLDGNTLTFGAQSSSPGLSLTYADNNVDTLTFFLNRSTASFLWAHTAAIAAMRLTANHDLVLYKSDGTTAGVTLTPATNTISLGTTTLYRDSSTGALRTNGALTVDGAATVTGTLTAPSITSSNGTLSGGSSGLTLNAGGTNQSITLTPSGTGDTFLNGRVSIGVSVPSEKLDVAGFINVDAASGYKQGGNTILRASGSSLFVGQSVVSGSGSGGNTAVGYSTLGANTTGNSNVAIGERALNYNTTGNFNSAVGVNVLAANTSGRFNTALGMNALLVNSAGWRNVAVGVSALEAITSNNNTAVGFFAGSIATTGVNNLFLGAFAGQNLTTGSNNLIIGYSVDAPSDTGSNQLTIGNLIYGVAVDGTGTTVSTGRVGIGTATPASTEKLEVNGNTKVVGKLTATTGGRFDGPVRIAPQGDLSMGSFTTEP